MAIPKTYGIVSSDIKVNGVFLTIPHISTTQIYREFEHFFSVSTHTSPPFLLPLSFAHSFFDHTGLVISYVIKSAHVILLIAHLVHQHIYTQKRNDVR